MSFRAQHPFRIAQITRAQGKAEAAVVAAFPATGGAGVSGEILVAARRSNQSLAEQLRLRVATPHELRLEKPSDFDFAAVAPYEIFCKISQNLSPAGVRSPFVARTMPTDCALVVPVSGR
jgi:hypothetical protein